VYACLSYWGARDNNIFNSYIDALLGFIPLIVFPVLSLVMVIRVAQPTTWNYTFPIISICVAGMYDAYGRYKRGAPRNVKLGIRTGVDFFALVLSAILMNEIWYIRLIPTALLALCGIALIFEVFLRVNAAIQMSDWYRDPN